MDTINSNDVAKVVADRSRSASTRSLQFSPPVARWRHTNAPRPRPPTYRDASVVLGIRAKRSYICRPCNPRRTNGLAKQNRARWSIRGVGLFFGAIFPRKPLRPTYYICMSNRWSAKSAADTDDFRTGPPQNKGRMADNLPKRRVYLVNCT